MTEGQAKLKKGNLVLHLGGGSSGSGGMSISPLSSRASLDAVEPQTDIIYSLPWDGTLTDDELALDQPDETDSGA